jgi:hypothetical protein
VPFERPIVCVVYAELTTPVVRAQTMPLLTALREAGHRVDAAAFTSPRRLVLPDAWSTHHEAFKALETATGRRPFRMTHLPRDRGLVRLGRALAAELRQRDEADAVLFCRQPRAALVGIAAREELRRRGHDARVVLDLRGVRDVEYLLTIGKEGAEDELSASERERVTAYREQEHRAVNEADAVLCVSNPMVQLVGQRYGISHERLGAVANHARPVEFAEDLRGAARGELNITGEQVLMAYCGTLAAWQMAEGSGLLYQALRANHPQVRMLYLTPDGDGARALVKRLKLQDVLVRSAPQEEVPRFLCAADYGLLLRQSSPVNHVACPVKFGEYLACGVRPLVTAHIGDQSRLCGEHDLGVVLGLEDVTQAAHRIGIDIDGRASLTEQARAGRREWAREHIAPDRTAVHLVEFLERALA